MKSYFYFIKLPPPKDTQSPEIEIYNGLLQNHHRLEDYDDISTVIRIVCCCLFIIIKAARLLR